MEPHLRIGTDWCNFYRSFHFASGPEEGESSTEQCVAIQRACVIPLCHRIPCSLEISFLSYWWSCGSSVLLCKALTVAFFLARLLFLACTEHQDVPSLLSVFHCPKCCTSVSLQNPSDYTFWGRYSHFTDEETKTERNQVGSDTSSVQFSSVAQLCPTLCDPMNRSTPGLPVHHKLREFAQTHARRVGDAIQPSHPLSSPSPPAPHPSQHQVIQGHRSLTWCSQDWIQVVRLLQLLSEPWCCTTQHSNYLTLLLRILEWLLW